MAEDEGALVLRFPDALALSETAEAALEDYARVLSHARAAEALREGALVTGVRLSHGQAPPAVVEDIERFARGLVTEAGGGLGWS